MPVLRSQSPHETKAQYPASLIKRPANIPDREIAPPTSLTAEDMTLMVDGKDELQVQLNMLVLKKAELEIDVRKLETDLLYWSGVYEGTKSSRRKGVEQKEPRSCYQTETTSQTSLLRIESSSSGSLSSEYSEISYSDASTPFRIPRKEVPIKEMIARVQETSMFSLGPARSRGNSWSEGDDLFMMKSCGLESKHPGLSIEFVSTIHAQPHLSRDDSAVDMSADVRCAMEELASGSDGLETR